MTADVSALRARIHALDAERSRLYYERVELQQQLADATGVAMLPRPRNQTEKQRLVACCPRCGDRLTASGEGGEG